MTEDMRKDFDEFFDGLISNLPEENPARTNAEMGFFFRELMFSAYYVGALYGYESNFDKQRFLDISTHLLKK